MVSVSFMPLTTQPVQHTKSCGPRTCNLAELRMAYTARKGQPLAAWVPGTGCVCIPSLNVAKYGAVLAVQTNAAPVMVSGGGGGGAAGVTSRCSVVPDVARWHM